MLEGEPSQRDVFDESPTVRIAAEPHQVGQHGATTSAFVMSSPGRGI